MVLSRRAVLTLMPAAGIGSAVRLLRNSTGQVSSPAVAPSFPSHPPELAREFVGASHGNIARVRELLADRPSLALASWDWGFGDWETALGAASHVGNREIAGLLLANGAPPTLFSAAMFGQLDVVQALIASSPGLRGMRGAHGITLMAHARAGGAPAAPVLAYLTSIGDADEAYPSEPLSDAARDAVLGTYRFAVDAAGVFRVTLHERTGHVMFAREGGSALRLTHLGNRVFHPAGATAVHITFATGSRARSVTVRDGALTVTASRA
jgi:hypothetical protein